MNQLTFRVWNVPDAATVPLSRTQIALYTVLAIGVVVGLVYDLPRWQIIVLALVVGITDALTDRKQRPPAQAPASWPWQRAAFWVVLALFAVLATSMAYLGTPVGINILICSLGLAFYGYHVARQIEARRAQIKGTTTRWPGVEDWTLLAVSIGFCVLALLIARHDWRTAVVTITFFGGCALVFLSIIRGKRRRRQWAGAAVRVTGGENIYMDAPRIGYIAVGCCVVGAVMYFVGIAYPLLFRLLGAFIGLVGVGLAIAIALGFYARNFMRFDPDALTISEGRMRYRIFWDNFARVVEIEYANNPFVGIELGSEYAVPVVPATRQDQFLRLVQRNRGFMGMDIVIAAANFGIDAPVLAAALTRYATNPETRPELVRRDRLAAPRA